MWRPQVPFSSAPLPACIRSRLVGSQGANKALAKVTSLQLQTHLVTPVLAEATFFFTSHIPASLFDSVVSALPADRFAASSAGLPTHAG